MYMYVAIIIDNNRGCMAILFIMIEKPSYVALTAHINIKHYVRMGNILIKKHFKLKV